MAKEPVDSYREYIHANVSKVRILGDQDERELKDVFVELSIVDQRPPPFNREFLGMWDAGLRKRFNPFADSDKDEPPEMFGQEEQKTKRKVKPGELLKPRTKAIVTGAPGCGKTTLLKFLALQAQEKEDRLTVWLELKAIDKPLFAQAEKLAAKNGTLILQELWLKHIKTQMSLTDAEIKTLREHWQEKFRANQVAVLLDGFDEVQDEAIESSLNRCINQFASAQHSNTLLISTRPYAQHRLGSQNLQELEIEPLKQQQIEAFLNCYYPNDAAAKSLLKNLRERTSLRELLHVPLLLGVVLQLQREDKFTDDRLPLYETIVGKLVEDLDRSKSIRRRFKIDDKRLRLDFVKFLAFERLLRDRLTEEEPESSRLVFGFDLIEEKARTFLSSKRLPHNARDLAEDAIATPLLREVGKDDYAFTHLTLQEYLAAQAFAAFFQKKANEFEGLKIFCRAYHNPIIVEMEVLPMALGLLTNADKFYAEIERLPESLTFTNSRVKLRGLVFGAKISDNRCDKIIDRVLDFIAKRKPEESNHLPLFVRSLTGIKGQYAARVINCIAALFEDKNGTVRCSAAETLAKLGNKQAVDTWVLAMSSQDPDVRWSAAHALGNIGNEQAVRALIDASSSEYSDLRLNANSAIGQIKNEHALESLILALSSEDIDVRGSAACALGTIGNEKAVDKLIQALSDEDRDVRRSAAEALGEIGNENAVEGLILALNSEDEDLRQLAAEALGDIGNDNPVPPLIKALSSEYRDVREHAAYALQSHIGNEQALEALILVLSDSDEDSDVRLFAAEALEGIGNEKALVALNKVLGDKSKSVRLHVASGHVENEKSVDVWIEALSDRDGKVRGSAAHALGEIGNELAVEPLMRVLNDEDADVQWLAAKALGQIGTDEAVAALILALSDENSNLRQSSVLALRRTRNEKAVVAAIGALFDEDCDVRGSAARTLGEIGNEKAVEALTMALVDEDGDVRLNATKALGNIGNDSAVEALIKALNGEDSGVRLYSTQALGEIGSEKAVDALINALSDEYNEARRSAASALGWIGGDKAVEPLIKALRDKDRDVQFDAAEALGRIGSETAVDALILALSSDDLYLRRRASYALRGVGDERTIEAWVIALRDEDRDVRLNAAEALGTPSGNEKAVGALILALRDEDSDVREIAVRSLGSVNENDLSTGLTQSLTNKDNFTRRKAAQSVGYYSLEPHVLVQLSKMASADPDAEVRAAAAEAKEKFARKLELFGYPVAKKTAEVPSDQFSYDVFLSYSSGDELVVRDLAERLRNDGLNVWFSEWEPGFGSLPVKLDEGLEQSRKLVFCMSANASGSDWARLELNTFLSRDPLNKEGRFLLLRLDDAPVTGSLAQFLYINWRPEDREREYPKLLKACRP